MLYSPYEAEVPQHVLSSVFEIRRFLTELLQRGGIPEELAATINGMRTACRKFIGATSQQRGGQLIVPTPGDILVGGTTSWMFNQALGELRGVFGMHIATLAVRYDSDVPDELATILPLDPADG